MKIGFSLCLLACLVSGLLAYRGSACAKCDYDWEACCTREGSTFCNDKQYGCPPDSKTEHGGYQFPHKIRETGNCECFATETCCIFATEEQQFAWENGHGWTGEAPFCLDISQRIDSSCPKPSIALQAETWAEILQGQQNGPPPPPPNNGRPPPPPPPPPSVNNWASWANEGWICNIFKNKYCFFYAAFITLPILKFLFIDTQVSLGMKTYTVYAKLFAHSISALSSDIALSQSVFLCYLGHPKTLLKSSFLCSCMSRSTAWHYEQLLPRTWLSKMLFS